jgi:uracil-DNA glycosylase family 4
MSTNAIAKRMTHLNLHLYGHSGSTIQMPPKVANIHALMSQCVSCVACPAHTEAQAPVPGLGNAESEIVLIGRNPGINEDKEGAPFVGAGGQLLDRVLEKANIDRTKVYVTNMVHCHTEKDRPPDSSEIAACIDIWLKFELKIIRPKLIIGFGDQVSQAVLGLPSKQARLKAINRNFGDFECPVIICIHPGAPLHNPRMMKHLIDDSAFIRVVVNDLFGNKYAVS